MHNAHVVPFQCLPNDLCIALAELLKLHKLNSQLTCTLLLHNSLSERTTVFETICI